MLVDPTIAKIAYGQAADLPTDLKSAAKAIEEQFVQILFATMRKANTFMQANGAMGFSKDVAESMLDGEIARLAVEDESAGLWKVIYDQLAPAAGVKSKKAPAEKNDGGILRKMPYIVG